MSGLRKFQPLSRIDLRRFQGNRRKNELSWVNIFHRIYGQDQQLLPAHGSSPDFLTHLIGDLAESEFYELNHLIQNIKIIVQCFMPRDTSNFLGCFLSRFHAIRNREFGIGSLGEVFDVVTKVIGVDVSKFHLFG